MNLIFRMLRVLFNARHRSRIGALDETSLTFRVWPSDLDVLLHMNNGRYLTLMDLGRVDSIIRSGIRRRLSELAWYTVIASETIRFRESLEPFKKFELRTRLLGWDDKSFYMRQTFMRAERTTAVAVVRIRFLRRAGGTIGAREVAARLLPGVVPPPLPDYVEMWQQAEVDYSR
ncbi:MAG: thioesterase family protein [Gemmatimonadaceae bacterium]